MMALAVPLVTVSFAALIFLFERTHSEYLQEELGLEIERTAKISGQVLAAPMWYGNAANITEGLEVLLGHDDVLAAVSRDAEGRLLAWCASEPEGGARCGRETWPGTLGGHQHVEKIFFGEERLRQEAGELQVFYADARVDVVMRRRLQRGAVLFAGLLLALVAAIFYATRRAVLMPLERWRQAIRTSRGGSLPSVDWASADEIGELIREYNERVNEEHEKIVEIAGRLKVFQDGFESLHKGVCIFDRDFRLVAFNQRYLEILDHSDGTVQQGMSLKTLLRANAARGEYGSASIDAVIIDRLAIAASNQRYRRERERVDGTIIEVESSPTSDGGFISIYTDITDQRAFETQMRHMTLHDTVTGLPNRALFHDRLHQALALADRVGLRLAVLLIDVDRFRFVNENHGREVGDEVLRELGDRLRHIVRQSDTAARLEGDWFAVLQQYVSHVDDAALLGHRILGSLSRMFEIGDHALKITATIGITVYPDDDQTSRNVLKNAHLALTTAKAEGPHRYHFFVPEVGREVSRRRHLEEELFSALRENQLVLYYQPRIELRTGALAGAEALVRWQHPERGLLLPAEFMEFAEEKGLIVPLTEWVLEEACRQRHEWQGRDGAPPEGAPHRASSNNSSWRVAVPLPVRNFEEGTVVDSVRGALEKSALDHSFLEVEISTAALLRQPETVAQDLDALHEMGVGSIVGDFGDGTSPLHSVRHLPIDAIKIDRRLIQDLGTDTKADAIVKAVIGVGQKLGLKVSAAGVEEPELLERLKEEGCGEAQGGAISAPLSSWEFAAWLSDRMDDKG